MNDEVVVGLKENANHRSRETSIMKFNWPLVFSFLALVLSFTAMVLSALSFAYSRKPAPPAAADYQLYNSCLSAQNANLTPDTFMRDPNGETINRFCAELAHVPRGH